MEDIGQVQRIEVEGDSEDLRELYRELFNDGELHARAVEGEGTDGAGEPIIVAVLIEVAISVGSKIAEKVAQKVGRWFRRKQEENNAPTIVIVADGKRIEVSSGDQLVVILTGAPST